MADTKEPKKPLSRLTREKFQEEVARELGIDLNGALLPNRDVQKLEVDDLTRAGEDENDSSSS